MYSGEIVKRLREEKGMLQRDLAKLAGIPQPTLSHYENKRPGQRIDMAIVEAIARALDVSVDDLREKPPAATDESLKELVERYGLRLVVESPHRVPLLRARVSAGLTGMPSDGEIDGTVEGHELYEGRNVVAARVRGDCLRPAVEPGDLVFSDIDLLPHDGDLCLLIHDGEVMVKRATVIDGQIVRVSGNAPEDEVMLADGTRVYGRVIELRRQV